jgi:hypothetical protein
MRRHRPYLLAFALFLAACGGEGGGSSDGGDGDPNGEVLGVQLTWNVTAGAEGFVIHWGMQSGVYPNALDVGMPPPAENGTVGFFLEQIDESGTYVFALTAYDAAGSMSGFSNEIVVEVP